MALAAVAKFLLAKAMGSKNQESEIEMPEGHIPIETGGSGLGRKVAAAFLGGGEGGGEGNVGGNSPQVGSSSNMLDRFQSAPAELQTELSQPGDPNYLRAGAAALAGYHQGGLGGVVSGWRGSIDQQQNEHEKQVMRRFYGDKARRAGGF